MVLEELTQRVIRVARGGTNRVRETLPNLARTLHWITLLTRHQEPTVKLRTSHPRRAGMRYVKATNLSPFEAEDLLAKIWIALEKHGLSSPEITIFSRATKIEIEFLFE